MRIQEKIVMTTTVYCAECGAELTRKQSDVCRNTNGLYFCNRDESARYYKRTGTMRAIKQQRGWRPMQRAEVSV
jgi:hypothetical protein